MFRTIRLILAVFCFTLITLLFLDFTGTLHRWFGWLAKIQFVPALLAMNVVVISAVIVLTLLLGRVYCAVICPLGVYQDCISRAAGKWKKNRFSYLPAMHRLRWTALLLFIIALAAGINAAVALFEPYSAYGRIASNLFAPLYQGGNNLAAYEAERFGSDTFYPVEVWTKSTVTLTVAVVTFMVITVSAWRSGRIYCNTVCPVGTVLGSLSRFSFFKPAVNTEKCIRCGLCVRNCKSSCIDRKTYTIDYSRCVSCMNCIEKCKQKALTFVSQHKTDEPVNHPSINNADVPKQNAAARRLFISVTALFALTNVLKAQEKSADGSSHGGLAVIEEKKSLRRTIPVIPAGSQSAQNMMRHCTACQLCVSVCPNQVLRPSADWTKWMQPEMSFERGYCRPECTKCSEVCPTKAILPITAADKSAVQIGHAVWIKDKCAVIRDKVTCTNCERHCPAAAITLVPQDTGKNALKIPVIDTERCIGCGACENLCPVRPLSAVYVAGHERHRTV
ncbi:MAG: 4Fe-4S binding protein [Planctomycetaceae bacterium]|jgi:polyferredoxin|nr:4Fe-4S binding protein [Planctomycetaceae bacterium]